MKRLAILFIALFFILFPSSALADEGWNITAFSSDITIQNSGVVKVRELIDVDFFTLTKHGIFRDIPYVYEGGAEDIYTEIDVQSVKQNNTRAKFQESKSNGFVRLKIGDPDKTISGKNTYEIEYEVKGILRGFEGHDELYWNVTGNNWPVEIRKTDAVVRIEEPGITKRGCFEGYAGSTAECMIVSESPTEARFRAYDPLDEAQGLTVVVGYQKNLIPLLSVERPKTFWEKFIAWPSLVTLGISVLFGIGSIIYLWNKNGRDYWFGQNIFGKVHDVGTVKPIGAHETTVVEYAPPENLRPAELGVLMDERADTLDVTATIIDLATRGYLTITEVSKKWLFGKVDYLLTKKNKSEEGLRTYEQMLMNELFEGGTEVKISSLKQTFYDELKKIKEELYRDVVARNLFPKDPEKVRTGYYTSAFVMIFLGFFAIGYTIAYDWILLTDLSLGMAIVGLVLLVNARHMPRRTAYGRELYRRVKGYRLFIEKAETHRQKFFEKKNLFNEVLPYTIVFGLTDKFAKAMEEIGLNPSNPTWYSGAHSFNTRSFTSSMSSFSSSMSTAMASAPSSSGGFSGGGSSGGGFGGGGGGSW